MCHWRSNFLPFTQQWEIQVTGGKTSSAYANAYWRAQPQSPASVVQKYSRSAIPWLSYAFFITLLHSHSSTLPLFATNTFRKPTRILFSSPRHRKSLSLYSRFEYRWWKGFYCLHRFNLSIGTFVLFHSTCTRSNISLLTFRNSYHSKLVSLSFLLLLFRTHQPLVRMPANAKTNANIVQGFPKLCNNALCLVRHRENGTMKESFGRYKCPRWILFRGKPVSTCLGSFRYSTNSTHPRCSSATPSWSTMSPPISNCTTRRPFSKFASSRPLFVIFIPCSFSKECPQCGADKI